MSKGFEVIGWLWRRIDPSEGPGMWHHSVNAELMSLLRDRDDHDVRDLGFADHASQLAEQRTELLALLSDVMPWLRGALDCKEFVWDEDLHENGEATYTNAAQYLDRIANATQQRNATGGEG